MRGKLVFNTWKVHRYIDQKFPLHHIANKKEVFLGPEFIFLSIQTLGFTLQYDFLGGTKLMMEFFFVKIATRNFGSSIVILKLENSANLQFFSNF